MQSLKKDENSVVLVKKDKILQRYGNIIIENKKVIDIIEKPEKRVGNGFRLMAIYLLSKNFLEELKNVPVDHYNFEKTLSNLAKKGNVTALITQKPTLTLKYAWDLLGIKDYLLSKLNKPILSKKSNVSKEAMILGNVIIEDGASIMEGVCIKGPAYIGKNVVIGNRAILRQGVIVEEDSTIGAQMEIKNSIILKNSTTHSGFIGDSLIGENTKIAAGFITANARLDRQNITTIVRGEKVDTGLNRFGVIIGDYNNIGIRVSTMPGIITGNNVIIGPSTTVMKNIESNKKYYTKFKEIIEENAK